MVDNASPPLKRIHLSATRWLILALAALVWFALMKGLGNWLVRTIGDWAGNWLYAADAARTHMHGHVAALLFFTSFDPAAVVIRFSLYSGVVAAFGLLGWLTIAWVAKIAPTALLTDAGRFRWSAMGLGALVAMVVTCSVRFALLALTGAPLRFNQYDMLSFNMAVLFVFIAGLNLFVGFFEEAVFRGGLLRLAPSVRWLVAVAVLADALLFSAVHAPQPWFQFGLRAGIGVGLCWAALRMRGIELAAGLHAGWNLAYELFNPHDADWVRFSIGPINAPPPQHDLPWWLVTIVAMAGFGVYFTLLAEGGFRLARWFRLDRAVRISPS